MAFSFPALTGALTRSAIARKQGKRQGEEDQRLRRSESLQELILRSRNPQVVESDAGEFSLDPSRSREAVAARGAEEAEREEEESQRGALAQAIEQGFLPEDTEFQAGADFKGTLNEILEGSLRRAGTPATEPTAQEDANLARTLAQAGASERSNRGGRPDNRALNQKLDAAADDIRRFERDRDSLGEPPEPGETQTRFDRIAKLHGFNDFQHFLKLQRQRGTRLAGEPEPAAQEPQPENDIATLLEAIIGSSISPELKSTAQDIVDSPEMTPEEKLELLQELAG